ncbi:hypothetical protein BDV19DRAFT_387352 [Aspergillus venezuelensis]
MPLDLDSGEQVFDIYDNPNCRYFADFAVLRHVHDAWRRYRKAGTSIGEEPDPLFSTCKNTSHPSSIPPFPLGSITATGWLHDQLQLPASGQAGHLFDFYSYVAESTWVGGDWEYSELDEAAPYWFNYIVSLAWTINDSRLNAQAKNFLDHVLDHQAEDGWLGPETTRQTRGIWARSLLFMGLVQYAQVEPSKTERIVSVMHRFTILAHSMLKNNFTGLIQDETFEDNFDPFGFGLARTHELPMSLQWLYENHPRNNSDIIWETMELVMLHTPQLQF